MATNELFDTSIKVTGSFGAAGAFPVDAKFVVETIAERNDHVTQNRAYEGMLVYVKADKKTYQYTTDGWKEFGFSAEEFSGQVEDSLTSGSTIKALSANQGNVLNTAITTHTSDTTVHITAEERTAWNAKADTKEDIGLGNVTNDAQVKRSEMGVAGGVATLDEDGLVPASQLPSFVDDIIETDSYEALTAEDSPITPESGKIYVTLDDNKTYRWSGTQYVEIASSLALGETSATAYAGDKGKANADAIAAIIDGTTTVPKATDATTVNGLTVLTAVPADAVFTDTVYELPETLPATMITTDDDHKFITKTNLDKLDGIEAGANAYVHPNTHDASIIVEDDDHKFATKDQLDKLDGIEAGANAYVHPGTHAATMITTDETHRFVTDAEKSTWNSKADTTVVTQTINGLMAYTDKIKLDGIAEGANNYTHPESHAATMITTDSTHRFATDTQLSKVDAIPADPKYTDTTYENATTTTAGLMSADDKSKLDGIDAEANKYVHPESHAATMITEDDSHKFVTATQISTWNAKADTTTASQTADGLMSKEDKAKLDGVAEGANNYVHPESHAATMITEDDTHKFVTAAQITAWNAKADTKEDIGLSNVTNDAQVKRTEMGVANGVATLDANGLVPSSQLPSYVDDVIEVANAEAFPETGETGKIYVAVDTNLAYRWSGTQYVEISPSLAIGETDSTAYAGNKGKANADAIAAIMDGTTTVPNAAKVNNLTVETAVPADAVFTDTTYENATTTVAGLMSADDKSKLDGIATGANNYTHPESHAATMITEDTDHRFVTDTEKALWNKEVISIVEFDDTTQTVTLDQVAVDKDYILNGTIPEGKTVADLVNKITSLETRLAALEAALSGN